MTFRAIPLRPTEARALLTVNTPEALALIRRYCAGTTWAGSEARHVDVLWQGENLALLKLRYARVVYRVVARRDPKDDSSDYRAALRALSLNVLTGEHRFALEHRPEKHGQLTPRRLKIWTIALEEADKKFEQTLLETRGARDAAEVAAERKEKEQELAQRLFMNAAQDALSAAQVLHQREGDRYIELAVNGVVVKLHANGTVGAVAVSANQFAAIVQAIREN